MPVDDLGPQFITISSALLAITTLFVSIRIGERYYRGGLGWDDCLAGKSNPEWQLVLCIELTKIPSGRGTTAVPYGFGKHMNEVSAANQQRILQWIIVTSATWSIGIGFAKASFACLYLRLLLSRPVGVLNRALIVFLPIQTAFQVFYVVFQCRPVRMAWDTSVEGSCVSLVPMWWITFVCNISVDLILFIQPIPYIWQLTQLSAAKRIGVILMLSLGLFICIISVVRIVQSVRTDFSDVSYQLVDPMNWSAAEISALISCACIPALKQFGSHFPRLARILHLSSSDSDFAGEKPPHMRPRTRGNLQRGRPDHISCDSDVPFSWHFGTLTRSSRHNSGAAASAASIKRDGGGPSRPRRFGTTIHISSAGMAGRERQRVQLEGGVADSERATTPGSTTGLAEPRASVGSGGQNLPMMRVVVTREVNHDVTEAGPQDIPTLQRAIAEAWFPHPLPPEDVEAGLRDSSSEPQSLGVGIMHDLEIIK
ncbi:hypothetical protein MAPG_07254 [Magnaporthiopsis poae ATCC 64411]|uniref:Rhodopsin domain-containing protein n=1 Tax=Magnaporthiopsis poae (strain ATCC 64411 / 73-15) TaxID=644358 RepID=A0A0C4E465_MAGP6|nr:hypothetical protein MAPG_07254 [Magnaporthiopsis poae ATCC 64411]